MVPAFDQTTPYFSRLSARSALYSELCLLLDESDEPLSPSEYRLLVLDRNVLARSSFSSKKKLWKELHSRYRLDANNPLFAAFWEEWRNAESEAEKGLTAYVLLALNDKLVADLGIELLFPLLRRAPAELRVEDVLSFIKRSQKDHPELARWSENTRLAVSQKYCTSIRDFGLANGVTRKTTIRPALYSAPVRLIIKASRLADIPIKQLLNLSVFRLLAIDTSEIIAALSELNQKGSLQFRIQGDVVELKLAEVA